MEQIQMESELRIPFQRSGETAYIIDADRGLVRIGIHVYSIDLPEIYVTLPQGSNTARLSGFPQVQVPYSGKHFASMALETYLEDTGKIRDANMKLFDVREILPNYWKAYSIGGEGIEPLTEDIQIDDEDQQNKDKHSKKNLKLMKEVYGIR